MVWCRDFLYPRCAYNIIYCIINIIFHLNECILFIYDFLCDNYITK